MPNRNPYLECRPGCCRTGRRDTCYHRLECACHVSADKTQQARDAWQDYIEEVLKAERDPYRRQSMPAHCHDCHRTLRTRKDPPKPGTSIHQGRGYCTTCYNRRRKEEV